MMEGKVSSSTRRKGQFFSIIIYVPIIALLVTLLIYINWTKFTSDLIWMSTYYELERNGTEKLVLLNTLPLTSNGKVATLEVDDMLALYSFGSLAEINPLIPRQPWFKRKGEVEVDYNNLSYTLNLTPIIYSLLPPPGGKDECEPPSLLGGGKRYWPFRMFYSAELRDQDDAIRFPKSLARCRDAVFLFNETILVPTLHTSISLQQQPGKTRSWLTYTLLHVRITDEELAKRIVVSKYGG